jgi:hypothetical protein
MRLENRHAQTQQPFHANLKSDQYRPEFQQSHHTEAQFEKFDKLAKFLYESEVK